MSNPPNQIAIIASIPGNSEGSQIIGSVNKAIAEINAEFLALAATIIGTGRLLNVRYFLTHGTSTYTPTAGTNSVLIFLQGAGGSGGGAAANPGSSVFSWGTGGQGGAWLQKYLTSNFSGKQIVIGTGGAAPTAGGNNGNPGGASTFDQAGGNYSAGGGIAGQGGKGPTASFIIGSASGGTPATASNGDLNVSGQPDGISFGLAASPTGIGGNGGGSPWGTGGVGGYVGGANTSQAGAVAQGNGSGGGGAISEGTSAAQAGGAGADGLCIIYEFS